MANKSRNGEGEEGGPDVCGFPPWGRGLDFKS